MIYSTIKNDTTLIDTINFKVKTIPLPTATIEKSGKDKGLPIPNKLIASINNFDYNISYKVISYCIKYYKNSILQDSIAIDGNVIDDRLNKILSKLDTGEKCWIDDIKVQREDGEIEAINSIYFKKP